MIHQKKWMALVIIAFIAIAPTLALTPLARSAGAAETTKDDTYELLNLFGDVFERVRADYVEEVSDRELIEAAVMGMLTSLDPHSSYMTLKRYSDMKVETRGEFGGLGIQVTMESGLIKVISPIDGTPAFHAGIQAGDLVSHLDKEPVMGLNLSQAVEKMRGKVGTKLTLTIRRPNQEAFDVVLTRAVIKIESVRGRLEGDIGYVRITQFNERAEPGLRKKLSELTAEAQSLGGMKGLVLDLRNNPGGLLNQAVSVSDAFLERGEIVSTRARHAEETQRFNARPGDLTKNLPIVVLINGGSASASEIVAGALQDHKRALIMGTKSFGKGSVQTIIPLPGNGAMRLTTSRYYTPSGRTIQSVGIEPDIRVEAGRIESVSETGRTRESDLRGALKNQGINGNGNGKAKPDTEAEKAAAKQKAASEIDFQLARALDLLRGVALFRTKATN